MTLDSSLVVQPPAARHCLRLRVFDFVLELRADDRSYLDVVAFLLERFVIQEVKDPLAEETQLTILTRAEHSSIPIILFEGRTYPFPIPATAKDPRLERHFYFIILRLIAVRVRSHFLIHAAALSYRGEGMVLAGEPGYGKSVLTMALLKRGCCFLSDEFAAIGRDDTLLHPFPRKLTVTADSLQRTGFGNAIANAKSCFGKLALDVDELGAGLVGDPVPLLRVFILQDPIKGDVTPGTAPTFAGEPCCVPLPRHQTAMQMLKHYHPGGLRHLIRDEYSDQPLKLHIDMMNILRDTHCYALHVGQWDQELNLVMGVIDGD